MTRTIKELVEVEVIYFITPLIDELLKQEKYHKEETTNQLNKTLDRALKSGVFGVPTFIVSGELFWENDRVILLRHYLQTITESTKDY